MMVLKEANGWSDEQLFENCRFNLLVRSALGLMNMDDAVPVESTYYLFRKRIVEYEKSEKINLFEKTFASVTKGQATDFEVSGKSIRMDSKLLGSNIAWLSRYELIHETLRLVCQDIKEILANHFLTRSQKRDD
ncbi:MAG: transposase [Chitinophagaceae bacterium]|nr:transposase [Chitinophagaceae bacterium]